MENFLIMQSATEAELDNKKRSHIVQPFLAYGLKIEKFLDSVGSGWRRTYCQGHYWLEE